MAQEHRRGIRNQEPWTRDQGRETGDEGPGTREPATANGAIDAVVFDLGGVLIDWNPRYLFRKLLPDEAAIDRFLQTVCTPAWNAKQDAGRPFSEGVAELQAQWPEHAALIEAYHTRWIEMIGGPISETVDLLESLHRRGMPLYALTNWSAETFPLVRPLYAFFDRFAGIVVSGEEKLIKPDPAFYRILFNRYALRPERLVFIDDSEPNVETAGALAMDAIHYTSSAALRAALQARNLLV